MEGKESAKATHDLSGCRFSSKDTLKAPVPCTSSCRATKVPSESSIAFFAGIALLDLFVIYDCICPHAARSCRKEIMCRSFA